MKSRGRVQKVVAICCMFLFLLILPNVVMASVEDETRVPQTISELEEDITQILKKTNTPGAAVILTTSDEILWVGALGVADVENEVPVTPDTIFRVGSVSKSFTGLTMLKLEERGVLNLNDPLRELAPELEFYNQWQEPHPLLLAHLLEHTSGFDDMSLREYAISDPEITLEEAFMINADNKESRWPPGRHTSYSNVGPSVAAYAAELASGKSFEELVDEFLFIPLEMETSSFFPTQRVQDHLTKSYGADGVTEIPYSHIIYRPSGALNVTPYEMSHFLQMLLQKGSYQGISVISPEKIERFQRPETALSAKHGLEVGFGPGSLISADYDQVFIGHDGGIDGFLSAYGYLPEDDIAYFCVINSANGQAFSEINKLIRLYVTKDIEKEESSDRTGEVSLEQLNEYTGYYEAFTPRMEMLRFLEVALGVMHIELDQERLYITSPFGGKEELIPAGQDKFRGAEDTIANMIFIEDQDGGWFLQGYGEPVFGNLRSVPAWQYYLRAALTMFSIFFLISALIYALFWIPWRFFKKEKKDPYLRLRLFPLLPVLTLLSMVILLMLSMTSSSNAIELFGKPTIWSLGLFVLTIVFALTSVLGFIEIIRSWKKEVRLSLRIYSLLLSIANMTITLYLTYWGIIGIRIWV